MTTEKPPLRMREAARALLIDADGRVLLLQGGDPTRPEVGLWWFTPGGGLEPGETAEAAVRREVLEETGLRLAVITGPVAERTAEFDFEHERFRQHEVYFVARVEMFDIASSAWTEVERRSLRGSRWWSLHELEATGEVVFPETLPDLLRQVLGRPDVRGKEPGGTPA